MYSFTKYLYNKLLITLKLHRVIFVVILVAVPLVGCGGQSPEIFNRDTKAAVKVGMPKDEAIKKLSDKGFRCFDSDHITCEMTEGVKVIDCLQKYVRISYSEDEMVNDVWTGTRNCSGWGK